MSTSSEHDDARDDAADAEPSFWATVREALRGSEQDLTAIPIPAARSCSSRCPRCSR